MFKDCCDVSFKSGQSAVALFIDKNDILKLFCSRLQADRVEKGRIFNMKHVSDLVRSVTGPVGSGYEN